jgi:hypothetical protein
MFDEQRDIAESRQRIPQQLRDGIQNVCAERYQGAFRILEVAEMVDGMEDGLDLNAPFVHQPREQPLLIAAIMLLIVSLEAFINLIYSLLKS